MATSAIVALLSLAGCGQDDKPVKTDNKTKPAKLKLSSLYLVPDSIIEQNCQPAKKMIEPLDKKEMIKTVERCPKDKLLVSLARGKDNRYYIFWAKAGIVLDSYVERSVVDERDDKTVNVYLNDKGRKKVAKLEPGRYDLLVPRNGKLTKAAVIAQINLSGQEKYKLVVTTKSSDDAQRFFDY